MTTMIRPACLSDIPFDWVVRPTKPGWHGWSRSSGGLEYNAAQHGALQALYDAEWQRRGFPRSP